MHHHSVIITRQNHIIRQQVNRTIHPAYSHCDDMLINKLAKDAKFSPQFHHRSGVYDLIRYFSELSRPDEVKNNEFVNTRRMQAAWFRRHAQNKVNYPQSETLKA